MPITIEHIFQRYQAELDYDDIQLLPSYSEVNSRSECDTSVTIGKRKFEIPVVPANMRTVIDASLAAYLARNNYFYIMHRFDVDIKEFCVKMRDLGLYISISVGVNEDSKQVLRNVKKLNISPDYVTIDIAHGYCKKMKEMIPFTKDLLPDTYLIAGNVATREAAFALDQWGADSIKAGIANGNVCTTKFNTGFGRPQASTIIACAAATNKPIIADGGVKHTGDIAKALALGAQVVMAGRLFAGHDESPGKLIEFNEKRLKEYFGSASLKNKGQLRHIEGKQMYVDYKGPIGRTLEEIKENLQSSISYCGGRTAKDLAKTTWVKINRSV